jgi:hypothetical protein
MKEEWKARRNQAGQWSGAKLSIFLKKNNYWRAGQLAQRRVHLM